MTGRVGATDWDRTSNLRLRRPTLYPIELQSHIVAIVYHLSADVVNVTHVMFDFAPCRLTVYCGIILELAWRSGRSSMAELQPSKLATRVRFPSPAPQRQSGVMAAAADSKSAVREYVRVRVPPLAPSQVRKRLEGCPSGRWCNLGKVVWAQVHRGFESPPSANSLY